MSSEGIAPSVGRCWWAAIRAFCWASCPALSVLLICLPLQIYFTTRIATLLAVVLCLVNVDVMTRYNCKVCAFHICFLCAHSLICRDPKVVTIFVIVSEAFLMCPIYFRGKNVWNSGCFIVQAFAFLATAAASLLIVLRMYVLFLDSIIFHNWTLMGTPALPFGT